MQNHPSARFTSSSSASTAAFRFLSSNRLHPSSIFPFRRRNAIDRTTNVATLSPCKTCVQDSPSSLVKTTCSSADNDSSAQSFSFQSRLLRLLSRISSVNLIKKTWSVFFKIKLWNQQSEFSFIKNAYVLLAKLIFNFYWDWEIYIYIFN